MTGRLLPRVAEMAAVFMIGDGLLGLLQPARHVALWDEGALGAERTVRPFVGRPGLRQAYGAAQLAAGLWLASRQRAALSLSRGKKAQHSASRSPPGR